MSYIVERNNLYKLMDKEVWNLLSEHNAIVAGGAITSVFCNREVNDIDVYFRCEEDLVKVLASIFNIEGIYDYEMNGWTVHVSGLSQRTIMCSTNGQALQLMTFKYFPEIQDIFDTFDFTICMGAFDCSSKEFVFHPDFFKHNSQRYLKFNDGTAYPLMSLMRVDKYREKGYTISKAELLRVVFTCMNLNLTSWEDAKEHMGGMYGFNMDKAFDQDKEFNISELTEQLGTLQDKERELYTPANSNGKDFWELSEILFYRPEETEEVKSIVFDDSKYLYKCVDSDWGSPYAMESKRIIYKEGDLIEVPTGGLYFHDNSSDPYHLSPYWVECELHGGELKPTNKCGQEKVVAMGGIVKVVRTFTYDINGVSSEVEDYMYKKFPAKDVEL